MTFPATVYLESWVFLPVTRYVWAVTLTDASVDWIKTYVPSTGINGGVIPGGMGPLYKRPKIHRFHWGDLHPS